MLGVIRIFFLTGGSHRWIVLLCVLLSTLADSLSIASALPLISVAIKETAAFDSRISEAIVRGLQAVGLQPHLGTLLCLMVGATLVKATIFIITERTINYAVSDVAAQVRRRLMSRVLRVKWSYFARQPIGRLANAISLDATRSAEAFGLAARFTGTLIQTTVYVVITLFISWKLALIGALAGLVIVMALQPLIRLTRHYSRRQRKRTEELVTLTTDTLSSIKPLRAMARQRHFEAFFNNKVKELRQALRRQAFSKYTAKGIREPIMVIMLATGFYTAYTWLKIPLPEIIVAGILLRRVVTAIGETQTQLQSAATVEASYWSVHNLIAEAERETEIVGGDKLPTLERSIHLIDVTFGYGDKPVLHNFSMVAHAGRLTVLSGASGAGKTTITDLILGLYEPQAGEIRLDEAPLSQIDLNRWRTMVGYVPQELGLFHDTILANVTLGDPLIDEAAVIRALQLAGAWEFVQQLPDGLNTSVGEHGSRFSGGQRQRIALARALVLEPKLLILDEVSSALDPATEAEIVANIRGLTGTRTIIAITHRPIWVEMADRVYHVGVEEEEEEAWEDDIGVS